MHRKESRRKAEELEGGEKVGRRQSQIRGEMDARGPQTVGVRLSFVIVRV